MRRRCQEGRGARPWPLFFLVCVLSPPQASGCVSSCLCWACEEVRLSSKTCCSVCVAALLCTTGMFGGVFVLCCGNAFLF